MVCDDVPRKTKVIGCGCIFGLVSLILFIASQVLASASFDIGFEAEGQQTATFVTEKGQGGLDYGLYFKSSDFGQCDDIVTKTTITPPSGPTVDLDDHDCLSGQKEWMKENDPPLNYLGSFSLSSEKGETIYGDYTVKSSVPLWIVDNGEEFGEAVGGFFAMLGVVIISIILSIVACVLCCIGCCCMDNGGAPQQNQAVGAGIVVGAPVSNKSSE